jgi:hypothetical protein
MDILIFETCWTLNNVIIKQVTSSWSIFIQLCLHQFERVAPFKVKIIWYWNFSPFRFSAHKSSTYSGSLPSAVLSNSTINTMKCRSIFQRRDNNVEFIKSLCTYHWFIADSFLFTRYSVEFIERNYSQPYCQVKNNIDEETFIAFFLGCEPI